MFEALGGLVAIALVIGLIVFAIVKAAAGSKRPPYGQPGMGMPPYSPGQYPQPGQFPQQGAYPQPGPYPPQGQWQQPGTPYPPPHGYQQPFGFPYPSQQGYPQQQGYPPAPQGNPYHLQGGTPPQG